MDDLAERLARLTASAVHDVLRSLRHDDCTLLPDIRPLSPHGRLAGSVVTISGRERPGLGTDETLLAWATLLSEIPPGGIVVCQPHTRAVGVRNPKTISRVAARSDARCGKLAR